MIPSITSVPQDTIIHQGDTVPLRFTASDIDQGDKVTLRAPGLPSWISFDPGTGILEGLATNDQVQYSADSTFTIQLKATDKSDAFTVQEFTVRVINVNDPPEVISQSTFQMDRNNRRSKHFRSDSLRSGQLPLRSRNDGICLVTIIRSVEIPLRRDLTVPEILL